MASGVFPTVWSLFQKLCECIENSSGKKLQQEYLEWEDNIVRNDWTEQTCCMPEPKNVRRTLQRDLNGYMWRGCVILCEDLELGVTG